MNQLFQAPRSSSTAPSADHIAQLSVSNNIALVPATIKGATDRLHIVPSSFEKRIRSFYHSAIDGLRTKHAKSAKYAIKPGYTHRIRNVAVNKSGSTDEWQREVYQDASKEARRLQADVVFDVGCGSGYKLVHSFPDTKTVGFELPRTVQFLRETYPNRDWRVSNLATTVAESADVVIAADVIEHMPDPDQLMGFLSRLQFRTLFLSTPERILVYGWDHSGPPANYAHCREWTMAEFDSYVNRWFDIEHHYISNAAQGTQVAVCKPRASSQSGPVSTTTEGYNSPTSTYFTVPGRSLTQMGHQQSSGHLQ